MRKVIFFIVSLLPFAAEADETVIAALGDSLVQGFGLPPEEGFVPQLQAWLDAQTPDIRLINAGVSGDTTAGGLSRIAWTLTPEVDGLIVVLGGNDMLRGLDPALSRANIEGILLAAQSAEVEVLLVGMEAPGNYGPEYKSAFDAIYQDLAQEYDLLFADSFFEGLKVSGSDPSAIRQYLLPDGIHPSAEGVTLIVNDIGPSVLELAALAAK